MNSTNTEASLSISTQETPLLQNDPPQQPKIKNLKTKLLFVLRILIVLIAGILIAGILILYSIYTKKQKKPETFSPYNSGVSSYYCRLTPHPKLCRDSMSSVTNATALQPDPALLFTTSLQLFITELNHTTISIARALTHPTSNASLVSPGLSTCQTLISDSLSRLNRSFGSLGLESFLYTDYHNITDEVSGVIKDNSDSCLLALQAIDREVGVKEVKLRVEKGSKLLVNFISLFARRQLILDEFFTRFNYFEDEGYNYNIYSYFFYFDSYYLYGLDKGFLVCLYSVMYLFIALLYFLFWQ